MTRKQLTLLTILSVCLAAEGHAQGNRGRIEPRNVAELPIGAELDAKRTKQALGNILKAYPPSLTQVLQLDPSLLSNTAYLAPYPKLADFLNDHPAVAHSPAFFVGAPKTAAPAPKVTTTIAYRSRAFDTLAYAALWLGLIGGVAWLIRATIDHQKWLRLSRAQSDAQSKILERFTSNEDLLNFIQTPAGKHFLEASSMPMQPKAVSAPIAQILWSMQIGLVLFAGGVGLELVSSQAEQDTTQTFHMLGILVIALGVGFILSGFSSYVLSRKLGLLNPTNVTPQPPLS